MDQSASASIMLGGQRKGGEMRLFHIYREGNFIEATDDTPYLQIGEFKYGKPILDRVVRPSTSLTEGRKVALLSMDSTMRSNLSVGMPLDLLMIPRDACRGRPSASGSSRATRSSPRCPRPGAGRCATASPTCPIEKSGLTDACPRVGKVTAIDYLDYPRTFTEFNILTRGDRSAPPAPAANAARAAPAKSAENTKTRAVKTFRVHAP